MRVLAIYAVMCSSVVIGFAVGLMRAVAEERRQPEPETKPDMLWDRVREDQARTRDEYLRFGLRAVGSSQAHRQPPEAERRRLRGIEIIESGGGHGGDAA